MFRDKVKLIAFVGIPIFLIGWCIGTQSVSLPQAVAGEAEDAKLKELLEQRLTFLKDYHAAWAERPVSSLDEPYEQTIRLRLFQKAIDQTELELCGTQAARISVLEKMVTHAKGYEAGLKQIAQAIPTRKSPFWQLPPQVDTFDAEIALAREKAKKQ